MTQRILVTCAALAMCAAAGRASATESGFYLGGSLGQSDSGLRAGNVNYSDNDLGYKLIAGFRAFKLLAVEVNYVDLGNTNSGGVEAKTKALDGFVMGFLPIPVVDIYGKLGVVSWKTDASAPAVSSIGYYSPGFSLSHNGSDLAYGAGVQMHFGALAARAEFEAFDVQQASTPTLLSVGVTYTFF
jgi:Outer membrane protein beta-barrel domain